MGQTKNLSPRQELNLWPSVTPAMIFLHPADLKENRVCENVPTRVQHKSKSRCLKLFFCRNCERVGILSAMWPYFAINAENLLYDYCRVLVASG